MEYLEKVKGLLESFMEYIVTHISREENSKADALTRSASTLTQAWLDLFLWNFCQDQVLMRRRVVRSVSLLQVDPIIDYLKNKTLPDDKQEARWVKLRSAQYVILVDVLYKRGYSLPYLRCLAPEEASYVMREINEGICSNHSEASSLALTTIRQGYFWPTMKEDAYKFVQQCDKCQRYSNIPCQPPEQLTLVTSPWPFAQWGIDIIGPMPIGKGQTKFAVVAVDYFTKWT